MIKKLRMLKIVLKVEDCLILIVNIIVIIIVIIKDKILGYVFRLGVLIFLMYVRVKFLMVFLMI